MMTAVVVRPAEAADVPGMTALINAVILRGGTTAIETPLTDAEVDQWFVTGADVDACHVALVDGEVVGFQMISHHDTPDEGWTAIGTWVAGGRTQRGVGSALFPATCAAARARGLRHIRAVIRADNAGGLAYYRCLGFRDTGANPDFSLANGLRVGQVVTAFDL